MKEYFNFDGTASRSQYWAMIVIATFGYIVGLATVDTLPLFALVLMVAVLWYALAITVRRIRDTGNSLWWMLILFVPVANSIATIVWGFLPPQNQE